MVKYTKRGLLAVGSLSTEEIGVIAAFLDWAVQSLTAQCGTLNRMIALQPDVQGHKNQLAYASYATAHVRHLLGILAGVEERRANGNAKRNPGRETSPPGSSRAGTGRRPGRNRELGTGSSAVPETE